MARKKVRLEYIENETSRRVTYKKRVRGIVKKTKELSVLCGVDACAIVYSPYEKSPVVWPSCEEETRRILMEFKRKPEMDQSQRRFTQVTFLKQSVVKAEEKLAKLQRRNRESEIENLMADLLDGKPLEQAPLKDLGDLLWVIEDKIRSVQHRLQVLKGTNVPVPAPVLPVVLPAVVPAVVPVVPASDYGVWQMVEDAPSDDQVMMNGNDWHFQGH